MPNFDSLPNEMLDAIFMQVPFAQRQAMAGVCPLWNEIIQKSLVITAREAMPAVNLKEVGIEGFARLLAKQDTLREEIEEKFPFLLAKEDKRGPVELAVLLQKEELIYQNLWRSKKHPVATLFGKRFREILSDETNFSPDSLFSEKEQVFLRVLGVASGVIHFKENEVDLEQVFKMAAVIGNPTVLLALKEEEIPFSVKKFAFQEAAKKGHLACVIYLNEQYGKEFSSECKERAGRLALEGRWLDCFHYLSKQSGIVMAKAESMFGDIEEVHGLSSSPDTQARARKHMMYEQKRHNTVRTLFESLENPAPKEETVMSMNDEVGNAITQMDNLFSGMDNMDKDKLSPLSSWKRKRSVEEQSQKACNKNSPHKKRPRMDSPSC